MRAGLFARVSCYVVFAVIANQFSHYEYVADTLDLASRSEAHILRFNLCIHRLNLNRKNSLEHLIIRSILCSLYFTPFILVD